MFNAGALLVLLSPTLVSSNAVNFTLYGNHMMELVLADAGLGGRANEIFDHGCWCGKLKLSEKNIQTLGGHPLDSVDTICREWSMCTRCVRIEGYCESSKMAYFAINTKQQSWTCEFPQTDFCAKERCVCDLSAAIAIRNYLKSYGSTWQSKGTPSAQSCQKPGGVPIGQDMNRCCKGTGMWVKYNNVTHDCDMSDGTVTRRQIQGRGGFVATDILSQLEPTEEPLTVGIVSAEAETQLVPPVTDAVEAAVTDAPERTDDIAYYTDNDLPDAKNYYDIVPEDDHWWIFGDDGKQGRR